MTQLFPAGTEERKLFEGADRWLCFKLTGKTTTCSTYLGDQIKNGNPRWYHKFLASQVDAFVFEYGHCLKNAGKP